MLVQIDRWADDARWDGRAEHRVVNQFLILATIRNPVVLRTVIRPRIVVSDRG